MSARATWRIVPATAQLIRLIAAEEGDPLTGERASGPVIADHLVRFPGLAFAMIDEGRCMLAAGLSPYYHGRADAWMLRSTFATTRHLLGAMAECDAFMAARQRDPAFRRIEMTCLDRAGVLGFARRMRFRYEATYRCFDQLGRTYHGFARLADEVK